MSFNHRRLHQNRSSRSRGSPREDSYLGSELDHLEDEMHLTDKSDSHAHNMGIRGSSNRETPLRDRE